MDCYFRAVSLPVADFLPLEGAAGEGLAVEVRRCHAGMIRRKGLHYFCLFFQFCVERVQFVVATPGVNGDNIFDTIYLERFKVVGNHGFGHGESGFSWVLAQKGQVIGRAFQGVAPQIVKAPQAGTGKAPLPVPLFLKPVVPG